MYERYMEISCYEICLAYAALPDAFVYGLLKYVVPLVIFAVSFHLRLRFASFYDYGDAVCPQ